MSGTKLHAPARSRGFTLVELVIVVALMGVVAVAGVDVIRFSAEAYAQSVSRSALSGAARVTVDRMARELRAALPNSVRSNGACLEYIPVLAASTYLTLPVEAAATTFLSAPMPAGLGGVTGRVSVYPVTTGVYDLTANVISGAATLSAPDVSNRVTVTLASAHQFPDHSPRERYFVVADPVSFCMSGSQMFRFADYGFNATQPVIGSLPAATPGRALLAANVSAAGSSFSVNQATLQRNAIAVLDLAFTERGDTVRVVHEAQLRNVP